MSGTHPEQAQVVDRFHYLYYHAAEQTWLQTRWLGVHVQKCPLDLWIYQELLFELRPDVIIETGTYRGGSALFLACVCDLLGHGRVYSIDIERRPGAPEHPRIEYLDGSSTSDTVLEMVRDRIRPGERPLVILDSDHAAAHVRLELECYAPFVPPGGYLILEDTNINGHPVYPDYGPGPMEALVDFLAAHPEFESDVAREKLLLTFNPRGYVRRAGPAWTTDADRDARAGHASTARLGPALAASLEREAAATVRVQALEAELTAIRNSRLWRLGAPWRALRAKIGR